MLVEYGATTTDGATSGRSRELAHAPAIAATPAAARTSPARTAHDQRDERMSLA
jgi:hypothetical protein